MAILNGVNTAASDLFKVKASPQLTQAFKPVIVGSMNQVGETHSCNSLTDSDTSMTLFGKMDSFGLDRNVTIFGRNVPDAYCNVDATGISIRPIKGLCHFVISHLSREKKAKGGGVHIWRWLSAQNLDCFHRGEVRGIKRNSLQEQGGRPHVR